MFCERLVVSQSGRNVTRQEANAAVRFLFAEVALFMFSTAATQVMAWCFQEFFI
jgi:hypothetical protein